MNILRYLALKTGPAVGLILASSLLHGRMPVLSFCLIALEGVRPLLSTFDVLMQRARNERVVQSVSILKVLCYIASMCIPFLAGTSDIGVHTAFAIVLFVMFLASQEANFIFKPQSRSTYLCPLAWRLGRSWRSVAAKALYMALPATIGASAYRLIYGLPFISDGPVFYVLRYLDLSLLLCSFAAQRFLSTGQLGKDGRGVLIASATLTIFSSIAAPFWAVLYVLRSISLLLCASLVRATAIGAVNIATLVASASYLMAYISRDDSTVAYFFILLAEGASIAIMAAARLRHARLTNKRSA